MLLLSLLAACSDNNTIINEKDNNVSSTIPTTFTATAEGYSDINVSRSSSYQDFKWSTTDKITVFAKTTAGATYDLSSGNETNEAVFSGKPANSGIATDYNVAVYPANDKAILRNYNDQRVTVVTSLPSTQKYADNLLGKGAFARMAVTKNSSFVFKNMLGGLKLILTGDFKVSSITLETTDTRKYLSGNVALHYFPQSGNVSIESADYTIRDDAKKVTLDCYPGIQLSDEPKEFFIAIPDNTYNNGLRITITDTDGETMTTTTHRALAVYRSMFYKLPAIEAKKKVKHLFSVGENENVSFTRSNVYWDGYGFKFESNPWDYATSWTSSHVSHFYWDTDMRLASAYVDMNNGFDYSDKLFCGGNDKEHMINVNGERGYFVLSRAQWDYLLNSRPANLVKYGVNVAGNANCLVIAPDNYEGTIEKTYTEDAWAVAEESGLVCLPLAGTRYACERFVLQGENAYYMTSTLESAQEAWTLSLNNIGCTFFALGRSTYGYNIRLVKSE